MGFFQPVYFYELVERLYIFQEFLNTKLLLLELEFLLHILEEAPCWCSTNSKVPTEFHVNVLWSHLHKDTVKKDTRRIHRQNLTHKTRVPRKEILLLGKEIIQPDALPEDFPVRLYYFYGNSMYNRVYNT